MVYPTFNFQYLTLKLIQQFIMKTIVENKKRIGIDTEKTKVLLIGVSEYIDDNHISNIPNIKQNIKLFKEVLLDKDIMGIPKENITVSLNDSKKIIERKLIKVSREAENENYTLLVYYSGHGILSSENFKLYLTSKESSKAYLESDSINIDRFRRIIANSRAASKIVILDACHSGQIHNAMNNFESAISSELKKFEGTYIMTSASEDNPSLFPHNDTKRATYFTDKMINIFKSGIENNKPYISMREIFNEIYNCFNKQSGLPLPQQSIFKDADSILISKNRMYSEKPVESTHFSYAGMQDKMVKNLNTKRDGLLLERKFLNLSFKNLIIGIVVFIVLFISATTFVVYKRNFEDSKETVRIEICTALETDTILNKKEYVNPVYEEARIQIRRGNKLYTRGEYYFNDALIFYMQANNLLKGENKNLKYRIRDLRNEINNAYNKYMEHAEIYSKADDAESETLEALHNALNLKPKDAIALRKIKEIKSK